MTSPATVRLMGLLGIVGMVAAMTGCGVEEQPRDSRLDLVGVYTSRVADMAKAFMTRDREKLETWLRDTRQDKSWQDHLEQEAWSAAESRYRAKNEVLTLLEDGVFAWEFRGEEPRDESYSWTLHGTWTLTGDGLLLQGTHRTFLGSEDVEQLDLPQLPVQYTDGALTCASMRLPLRRVE